MPLEINWVNEEKTIMMHKYIGSWTIEENMAHLDTVYEIIDNLEHNQKVDMIIDVQQIGYPPTGMMSRGLQYYRNKRHPQQGILVIVGKTFLLSFMKGLTAVAATVIPQAKQVRFVDTIEEALHYIQSYRSAHIS